MGKLGFSTNKSGFAPNPTPPHRFLPHSACDSHMHIVGPLATYPFRETRDLMPPEATWDDYQSTASKLGLTRSVIVQPSFFGFDNRCTLDSVAKSDGNSVGVIVVGADVTTAELAEFDRRGARAIRSQMIVAGGLPFDDLEVVAERIAPLGWHVELYLDTKDLPEIRDRVCRLPVPVVFDHMGQALPGDRTDEPGFKMLLELVGSGKAWAKLANPRFTPSAERARQLIAANPERLVWGSDWPHVSYRGTPPDDGHLLDALADWIPDEAMRNKILVSNPDELYFSKR